MPTTIPITVRSFLGTTTGKITNNTTICWCASEATPIIATNNLLLFLSHNPIVHPNPLTHPKGWNNAELAFIKTTGFTYDTEAVKQRKTKGKPASDAQESTQDENEPSIEGLTDQNQELYSSQDD